ncbi:uncharacterized protein [Amphiura filiformis]|uniref:uncharacterized protein n=1 Tax=Amphiura filiformis TaxID=82378 RepID=UPI003B210088
MSSLREVRALQQSLSTKEGQTFLRSALSVHRDIMAKTSKRSVERGEEEKMVKKKKTRSSKEIEEKKKGKKGKETKENGLKTSKVKAGKVTKRPKKTSAASKSDDKIGGESDEMPSKKKGKSLVATKKSKLFVQHQKAEEKRNLQEAKRQSAREAMRRRETERVEAAGPENRVGLYDIEGESTPSVSEDDDDDSDEDWSDEDDDDDEEYEEEYEDDVDPEFQPCTSAENVDEDGDGEVPPEVPQDAPPVRRRKAAPVEADSDDDPDPPKPGQDYYRPDKFGWCRSLEDVSVQPFKGATPHGPTFQKLPEPMDYFLMFMSITIISSIAKWTNKAMKTAGQHVQTSVEEIKAWIGIHLVMGLVRIPYYQDYWSKHLGYRNNLIASTMSRHRFDTLSSFLHGNDPDVEPLPRPDQTDKPAVEKKDLQKQLGPVMPVWEEVILNSQKNFNLGHNVTIDEAMVKYRGFRATTRKFFMPLKPIRSGFKLYALADSITGYTANFITHPFNGGKPSTMKDIAMTVMRPFLFRFHHLFTDKLYTSVNLANDLLANETYLTGTVKSNSSGLPEDFKAASPKIKRLGKCDRGTFTHVSIHS